MKRGRLIYHEWIVELGHDPDRPEDWGAELPVELELVDRLVGWARVKVERRADARERVLQAREAVVTALAALESEERELIERLYYMGQSYREVSEASGRAVHRLEAIHKRALKRLRKLLSAFVRRQYRIRLPGESSCPVCQSKHRAAIDRLLHDRDRRRPWTQVIQRLKRDFQIRIKTPRILEGHEKYHC
jgi:hypothetical protein